MKPFVEPNCNYVRYKKIDAHWALMAWFRDKWVKGLFRDTLSEAEKNLARMGTSQLVQE